MRKSPVWGTNINASTGKVEVESEVQVKLEIADRVFAPDMMRSRNAQHTSGRSGGVMY